MRHQLGEDRRAAVLPWIPLFQGGDEPGIISAWVDLAQRQADADVRRALPLTLYFAEAAGCVEAWREAMKEWDVVKSQVFEEWTSQAHQQGVKDTLLRFLRRNQANLPPDLEQAIRAIEDLGRLNSVLDVAFSSASLDDFRRATGL